MAPVDPHSYLDSDHPRTKSAHLHLQVDFKEKCISGTARLILDAKARGSLNLDTKGLVVERVTDSTGNEVSYSLGDVDAIKGSLLTIRLEDEEVNIQFKTTEKSEALQWLDPAQTAGGKVPYVFTQCQSIHARSVFPCQDSPSVRFRYTAKVEIPVAAHAVMSAKHVSREEDGDVAVETFSMDQPIPAYLFALAVGDIASEQLSPRSRVYAEPSVLKGAAYEFADTEDFIKLAEAMFGEYEWEEFNVLVMPPSFPYGGMENPRMAFLTPTLLVGDRSLVGVVAHELAHSWTGNLVTNATMNDFWLNEGWTTYAERRIQEAKFGMERMELYAAIGYLELQDAMKQLKGQPEMTRLKTELEGVDPDQVYSTLPYEKGYLFLRAIETQVGRPAFDAFIRKYIARFRFQSITTETFLEFLLEHLPEVKGAIDIQDWVYSPGLPATAPVLTSPTLTRVKEAAAAAVAAEGRLDESTIFTWKAEEWQIFLGNLPRVLPHETLAQLDASQSFSSSKNTEICVGFLTVAAASNYQIVYPHVWECLQTIGRMKYLRPLYTALVEGGSGSVARTKFEENKAKYHPVAQAVIHGLLKKHHF